MKNFKKMFTLGEGQGFGDFLLIVALWLTIGVGGLFTISAIGRYLMQIKPVYGEIFGGAIIAMGLIELYCYWITCFIKDGKKHYNGHKND